MKFFDIFGWFSVVIVLVTLLGTAKAECEFGGKIAQTNEEFQISGECNLYICNEDGGISAKTCALEQADDTCTYIPQDNSKPYPSCCEKYIC